jgi:hypothetical protein
MHSLRNAHSSHTSSSPRSPLFLLRPTLPRVLLGQILQEAYDLDRRLPAVETQSQGGNQPPAAALSTSKQGEELQSTAATPVQNSVEPAAAAAARSTPGSSDQPLVSTAQLASSAQTQRDDCAPLKHQVVFSIPFQFSRAFQFNQQLRLAHRIFCIALRSLVHASPRAVDLRQPHPNKVPAICSVMRYAVSCDMQCHAICSVMRYAVSCDMQCHAICSVMLCAPLPLALPSAFCIFL